ncbi:MAG: lysogenization protein HflD [Nevskiales bacterium]
MNRADRRGQVIALAGLAQFCIWAHRLAQHGERREERLSLAVDALLCTEPPSAEAVFGGVAPLQSGLVLLEHQLSGRSPSDKAELAYASRYAGQLLRHAGTVLELPHTLALIRQELAKLQSPSVPADSTRIKPLAELYQKTISPIRPRILVTGNPLYLRNEDLAAAIRCLLFAGLRAAVLWRQCGGRLWQLLLNRKALLAEVHALQA